MFEQIRDTKRGSVVIISHQERILNIADKIVVISNGEIDTVGTRDEILPKLLLESDTYQFHKVREQQ